MTQHQKYSSREEQALAEAGRTTISPAQKRLLAVMFLFAIFFVPVSQQIIDMRAYLNGSRSSPVPQCYDIFAPAFPAFARGSAMAGKSALKKICRPGGHPLECLFSANRRLLRDMRAYEDSLEDSSLAGRTIRPYVQYVMTRRLGAGNDKTYCGRGQWLFYRPDVDYVVNHGFLDAGVMKRRSTAGSETAAAPQPDPRPAIFAFNAELAARGIKLILMPTPVKPVIHPEKFAAGFENFTRPVHNAAYQEFIRDMEKAGISVFDASQALVQDKEMNKRDQFIAGDTHWRPEAMELCARLLSDFIGQKLSLRQLTTVAGLAEAGLPSRSALVKVGPGSPTPSTTPVGYLAVRTNIVQRGDIIAMLRLPESGGKYGKESVNIRQIFEPDGSPWQPRKEADILVLGDSFANIYSLEAMGWGASAGLVEQLSYEMQRPIDRIAANDNGARATRELLLRELSRGHDRLAGKRAVIWQFAARELTEGDWKIITLKSAQKKSSFLALLSGSKLTVTGKIRAIARVPRPGSVPYADHIIAAHLVDVADSSNQYGQALVYLFSMTNNILTRAASLKAGDTAELKLRPWSEVSAKYERINRTELDDAELLVQEPCWGEIVVEGK